LAKKAFIELCGVEKRAFSSQFPEKRALESSAKIQSLFYPLAYPIKRRDKNK
jgi:hypothetical protein